MATNSGSSSAAPWRAQFLSDIKQMEQPSFTFTSLHSSSSSSVPRARTCIYRGLWASLPPNDKNNAPRNPDLYESDMPVLTSDARMDKVPEIYSSGPSSGGEQDDVSHSGGGGPVEAMFWAVPMGTQWRIRGRAWVLSASDIASDGAGARAVRSALLARMRGPGGKGEEADWDWEREVVGHFGNLSPGMRGSFKNPSPGTPRAKEPGPGEGLGQKVGDELLDDELARRNFRVVVIVPDEVDLVNLKDPADQRRWLYTYVGSGAKATKPGGKVEGEWEVVELWP
ncbi:hypothetical protein M406DRAFT_289344 [Cryphonectria parasitica EP155]|uniref:Pyridoxamine 5'-phosphate oxidase Alr4036 family FMN-binding domain-containing protein n=1 Tax=Cryphonectria parasitica (strain ATCC 38755 / EP155) TaxID=660469 RepID=A0A9P5CR97_CRYP1|nr:uncharacterized protein M406DRAFT_289344 [Cryphonectria parasitica EP155]KAF3768033.1 hypothetical protein M406DRAFT_289344 [Cryphonectria parasitica EP155]